MDGDARSVIVANGRVSLPPERIILQQIRTRCFHLYAYGHIFVSFRNTKLGILSLSAKYFLYFIAFWKLFPCFV